MPFSTSGSPAITVTTSPAPIDVISAKQLQATGKPGLMEALSATVPSFTLPEKTGWDASGMARAPSLRGLVIPRACRSGSTPNWVSPGRTREATPSPLIR